MLRSFPSSPIEAKLVREVERIPSSYGSVLPASPRDDSFAPSSLVQLHNSLMSLSEKECENSSIDQPILSGQEELTELLHQAIVEGSSRLITTLLQERPDVDLNSNYKDYKNNGCTLMHKAAKYQRVQLMNLLFEKGASVESKDDLDATPLFYAAAAGCLQSCAFLLSKSSEMNIRDRTDASPLSVALRYGHMEVARMMILSNADVHYKVGKGDTVLHLACEEGNADKVAFLLKNGANPLRVNASNENCLCVGLAHPNVVRLLCKHATDQNQLVKLLRSTDQAGNAIVHRCALNGHYEALMYIIQSLPLPKNRDVLFEIMVDQDKTKNNDTALHMAASKGHLEVIKLIIDTCREFALEIYRFENRNGDTPLHVAIRHRKGECVELLRAYDKKGKVAKHKNLEKMTPKALAESLDALDVWNYSSGEVVNPDSPGMMARFFRKKSLGK
jgi:ankyrin repeat protein